MKLENEIELAIERVYEVFLPYKRRENMVSCTCCVSEARKKMLYAVSLRNMATENLAGYVYNAMAVWGDVWDFKHFLPRIMELVIKNELDGFGGRELNRQLGNANWQEWKTEEQEAVKDYLRVAYKYHVGTGMQDEFVWAGCNHNELLELWEISAENYSIYVFTDLVKQVHQKMYKGKEKLYHNLHNENLLRWMFSKKDLVFKMFLEQERKDEILASDIAYCYDLLVACEKMYQKFY